jgi:hypothetical protein
MRAVRPSLRLSKKKLIAGRLNNYFSKKYADRFMSFFENRAMPPSSSGRLKQAQRFCIRVPRIHAAPLQTA